MNEIISYVITCMAAERGITSDQMRDIIKKAIHSAVTSSDLALRRELMTRFGCKDPSAEEFIKEYAKMIEIAHHDE